MIEVPIRSLLRQEKRGKKLTSFGSDIFAEVAFYFNAIKAETITKASSDSMILLNTREVLKYGDGYKEIGQPVSMSKDQPPEKGRKQKNRSFPFSGLNKRFLCFLNHLLMPGQGEHTHHLHG